MTGSKIVEVRDVCKQDRNAIRSGERKDLRYIGMESIESNTGAFVEGVLSKTPEEPQANSFHFNSLHVLYGKLRPYLNKVALPQFEGKCSTEVIPLLPSDRVDRAYLAYFLRSAQTVVRISEKTAGARMPRANMDFVLGLQLPLPPIDGQRRIVDILSRAEGIVRLRREAQRKAVELVPGIFLDMFGDPATNPKGWPTQKVSDFVSRFEGGKNIQAGSESGSPYRILKVSSVTSGFYRESERKPAPEGHNPPASHIVRVGDMLFSRANTEQMVGATAIVEKTDGKTLLPDKLWRFVWAKPVDPAYMQALFQTNHVRRVLGKLSSGTSASMRNISQAKLFGLPLPVAPYDKQKEFGERAAEVHSIQSQQAAATAKAEATFAALLARFFAQITQL